jgi:hypothetical protein
VPQRERQAERAFSLPPSSEVLSIAERTDLTAHSVEPILQRELKHKGMAAGDGSYSAELIAYIEIK